jgi:hypothetical protein
MEGRVALLIMLNEANGGTLAFSQTVFCSHG